MFSRGVHMSVVCEVRLGEDVRLVDSWLVLEGGCVVEVCT